jgi:hypothetical protein
MSQQEQQQDNIVHDPLGQETPDITSSVVTMDEIQAILDAERAVRDAEAAKVPDADFDGQVALEPTTAHKWVDAFKGDLENLEKIEKGEYVAPPSDPYEGYNKSTREMLIWLNGIRAIETETQAELDRLKAEQQRVEQEAREEEERQRRRANKELGDSVALYILMRTDMASLNPGKAVAQGTHATNLFERDIRVLRKDFPNAPNVLAYDAWTADRGFGTAITLSVNGTQLETLTAQAVEMGCISGLCTDPTYPLRDGDVVHLLNINTCSYIFGNREALASILGELSLMY